jgi:hypothetical protein
MKAYLVVELIVLTFLVVYGWGPDFRTWTRRRKQRKRRPVSGVGLGAPFVVPEQRAASPGRRA